MRLLGLFGDGFGGFGGISQFNRDLLEATSKSGRFSEMIGIARSGRADVERLPAGLRWKVRRRKLRFVAEVLGEAARVRPDLILCGHINLSPVAAVAARLVGSKLWTLGYGIEFWNRPSRPRQWGLEQSSLVSVISRYTRRRVLSWSRLEPDRVRVLPCTFCHERFRPGPVRGDLAERYRRGDRRILLTVGRLDAQEAYKGQDSVIRALGALRSTDPGIHYIVVGDGSDRARLERLAAELHVADAVTFVGAVSAEELVSYYRLADVFVMPSTGEGFGIAFLEAAACGTPVVGGGVDGSVDALRDGRLGTVINPHDVEDVVRGVRVALGGGRRVSPELNAFSRDRFQGMVKVLIDRAMSGAS